MKTAMGLLKIELRLLTRNPLFYLVVVLCHGSLAFGAGEVFTSLDAADALRAGGIMPLVVLTALLAADAGRHHRASGSKGLFLAAPHREWEPILARLGAVSLASLFVLATMAFRMIVRQAVLGAAPLEALPFVWVLAGMASACLQAAAAGLLLGVLLPSWWAIALGTVSYWMLVGGPASSLVQSGRNWLFALLDNSAVLLFTVHPDMGGFPQGGTFVWGLGFTFGLALLLAGGATRRIRPHSRPFRPSVAGLLAIGIIVSAGCAFGFGASWNHHYAALAAGASELEEAWGCCDGWPETGPTVSAYDLLVNLDSRAGEVAVSARLTVSGPPAAVMQHQNTPLTHLVFTLAKEMDIEGIELVDGDATSARAPDMHIVRWERAANLVMVELSSSLEPHEAMDLVFRYRGPGHRLALTDPLSEPEDISYIQPRGGLLPGGGAWYPLPGNFPLERTVYQRVGMFSRQATTASGIALPEDYDGVPVPMIELVDGLRADYTVTVHLKGPGRVVATIPPADAEEGPATRDGEGSRTVFAGPAARVTLAYGDFVTIGRDVPGSPVYHVAPRYRELVEGHRVFMMKRLAFYNELLPAVDADMVQVIGAPLGLPSVDGLAGIVMTGINPWQRYAGFARGQGSRRADAGPAADYQHNPDPYDLEDDDPWWVDAGGTFRGFGNEREHQVLALWWPHMTSGRRSQMVSAFGSAGKGGPDGATTEAVARGMALYMHSLFRRHHLGEEAFQREQELRAGWVEGFVTQPLHTDLPPTPPRPSERAPMELSQLGSFGWIENHTWLMLAHLNAREGRDAVTGVMAEVHGRMMAGGLMDLGDVARLAGVEIPGEPGPKPPGPSGPSGSPGLAPVPGPGATVAAAESAKGQSAFTGDRGASAGRLGSIRGMGGRRPTAGLLVEGRPS